MELFGKSTKYQVLFQIYFKQNQESFKMVLNLAFWKNFYKSPEKKYPDGKAFGQFDKSSTSAQAFQNKEQHTNINYVIGKVKTANGDQLLEGNYKSTVTVAGSSKPAPWLDRVCTSCFLLEPKFD